MKIITSKPECVWKSKTLLGEGTLWVKSLNSIFFVDIKKKKIFILNTKNQRKRIVKVNKEIGFLSHVKKSIFILGLKGELRIVDLKTKKKIKSIIIEKEKPLNRLNDGKGDPRGRLWFGSMDSLERNIENGSLYCLDNNFELTKVDSNYMITNGPAFIDTKNFFHTDSRKKLIYKIKIDNNLKIIKKNIFKKLSKTEGSPDGMSMDIKNNLWICHYCGARVSVYNLKGQKIHQIYLPAKNVTNCAFGGIKNDELFISTARKGMSSKELKKYPLSGSLFRVKTNIKGKKAIPFKILNLTL